jgi:hypothetical protein
MGSCTDHKIRQQLKEEYAAIAELRNPAREIQLVRVVMIYKVNHVLRARTRTALIRRHDDLQAKALMSTLCLAGGTVRSEASQHIRRLSQRAGGLGIPSAADIADAACTGATLLTPELLGSLVGAMVEVPARLPRAGGEGVPHQLPAHADRQRAPHRAEAGQRVGAAGFATFGPRPALVAGRVQHQTELSSPQTGTQFYPSPRTWI